MATGMRRPSVRAAATWMLTALLTVTLAACARANTNPAPVDPEAGVLYAQCMRANGVPDFPDPDAEGRLRGIGHERQGDPKYQAAMETWTVSRDIEGSWSALFHAQLARAARLDRRGQKEGGTHGIRKPLVRIEAARADQ